MSEEMPSLELHQTVDISGTNMQITRVYGGYVYRFCEWIPSCVQTGSDSYQYHSVFVADKEE